MTDTPERDLIEKARRVGNYHGIPIVLELADTIEALLSRVDKLEEALKKAEKIAKSYATCGCKGSHGRCMVDDVPLAIAKEIRALNRSAS